MIVGERLRDGEQCTCVVAWWSLHEQMVDVPSDRFGFTLQLTVGGGPKTQQLRLGAVTILAVEEGDNEQGKVGDRGEKDAT